MPSTTHLACNATERVLALDLATTCGWALLGGGVITSGSQDFHRYQGSKSRAPDHIGEPFAMFHRWLSEKIRTDKPAVIAYEEMNGHYKGIHTPRALFGFRAVMLSVSAGYQIPCYGYEPSKVKKFWTGKGTSDKDAMIAETQRRLPDVVLTDSNEADALAILHLHLSRHSAVAA